MGSIGSLLLELESSSEGFDESSFFPPSSPPPPPVKRPPDPGGGTSPPLEARGGRSEAADVEREIDSDGLAMEGVDRSEREVQGKAM
jgi:hypothetical protein